MGKRMKERKRISAMGWDESSTTTYHKRQVLVDSLKLASIVLFTDESPILRKIRTWTEIVPYRDVNVTNK